MSISQEQKVLFDEIIRHARFFVTRELRKLNFSETKNTRFVGAARKPKDNKWRTVLPPLLQNKEGKWQSSRERSVIVAARSISEDIHAWQRAWEKQQWGLAVKYAYVIGQSLQLLQMVDFSTAEKRKSRLAGASQRHIRNNKANIAADLVEQERITTKKRKLTVGELHTAIESKGHKISLKNFFRIRQKWKMKKDSPGRV